MRATPGEGGGSVVPPGTDELARLVEVEDRIAKTMAEARLEAERILAEADARSVSIEEAGGREIQARLENRSLALDRERTRACQAIAKQARLEAGRYEAIAEERIAALAREIVEQVIEGTAADQAAPAERSRT